MIWPHSVGPGICSRIVDVHLRATGYGIWICIIEVDGYRIEKSQLVGIVVFTVFTSYLVGLSPSEVRNYIVWYQLQLA